MILWAIRSFMHLTSYVTERHIFAMFDVSDHAIKVIIGKLRNRGLVAVNEGGYINLTTEGKSYLHKLMGERSRIYERLPQTAAKVARETKNKNLKQWRDKSENG
jgi:Mn-dependent DtxR family transcriptional regulator